MTIGCTSCGDLAEGRLYGRLSDSESLCHGCWSGRGRPFPVPETLPVQELHEREEAVRRRMLKRGGSDRHVVRKGST